MRVERKWLGVAALAAVLVGGLRLFTAEVMPPDDPTVQLILRARPSLETRVVGQVPPGARVLAADENGFVGQGLWRWMVGAGWIVVPAAITAGSLRRKGAA